MSSPNVNEYDTRALVERFYHELWNRWELTVADEILAEDLRFRGSLGAELKGRAAFKGYVQDIRIAFADWHNEIDELLACDQRAAARLTWTGTHTGPLGDRAPTGQRVRYVGAGFFQVQAGRIYEAWIVGDTQAFWTALDRA
jgi:predicted ester cyclase